MSLLSWLSLQLLYSHLGMNTGGSRSGLSCLGRTAVGRRSRAGRAAAADGLSGEGKRCLRAGLGSSFQPGGVLRLAWNEPKLGREEVWGEQVEAEVEDLRSGGDNLSRREGGHLSDLLCRREGGHPFSQVLTRLLREPWGSGTSDPLLTWGFFWQGQSAAEFGSMASSSALASG